MTNSNYLNIFFKFPACIVYNGDTVPTDKGWAEFL